MKKATPPACWEQLQAFADKIRLTQTDMMRAANLSRTAISHYFKGVHEPRFGVLQKWGVIYNINMNWLFYGDGPMQLPRRDQDEAPGEPAQVTQLRLVRDRRTAQEQGVDYGDTPREYVMRGADAEAYEAQARLVDKVCESLAKNGADPETIQRAILAVVAGSF